MDPTIRRILQNDEKRKELVSKLHNDIIEIEFEGKQYKFYKRPAVIKKIKIKKSSTPIKLPWWKRLINSVFK